MKVALIQMDIAWHDPYKNTAHITEMLQGEYDDLDLIILPEMFSTGFTMQPEIVAESLDDTTVQWMKHLAITKNAAVVGSIVVVENNLFYNRLIFVYPDGKLEFYDKRHLFSLAKENEKYQKGLERLIINYKGFKICPLVCYDLRFPVFSRNDVDYDLLIYIASWPEKRINAWDVLLQARAIENMSYTIGVNRVGLDDNDHLYTGQSQIVDFLGNKLIETSSIEQVFVWNIDHYAQQKARQKFAFLDDRDDFEITI